MLRRKCEGPRPKLGREFPVVAISVSFKPRLCSKYVFERVIFQLRLLKFERLRQCLTNGP